MPYGNIIRNLNNNEGNMSGILTIQPTAGSGVSDVLVNGTSAVSDHKAYINIDVDQTVTEGQKIASININGQSTDILIPELNVYDESTGDLITIDNAAAAPVNALSVTLEPQQAGTGDPSPENVRPISGWTECKVQRTGKNLLNKNNITFASGSYDENGNPISNPSIKHTSNYEEVKPNTTYTLSGTIYYGSVAVRVFYFDKNQNWLGRTDAYRTNEITFTTPNNCQYYQLQCSANISSVDDWQLEIGSSASNFEPYNGTTYTINLGGTYYGGNLDAVQGKLIPYKYYPSYNGEALVGPWISSMDAYTPHGTPTTGAQVVDFGAFETEVTLTPTQIDLLRGVNNIWSDGEVYVKWKVDIEMMLQSIIDSRHI